MTERGLGMISQRTRQRLIRTLQDSGIRDQRVLDAMLKVPRHHFVDEALISRAYDNTPLPIGFGQTISQPYIVARMTELLLAGGSCQQVLEIGVGCGYQTAILAELVTQVYGIERINKLLERGRENLRALGYHNVRLKYDDGMVGWPRYAPFDGIIVAAASAEVPPELLQQLQPGGRLIIPIGSSRMQYLTLYERKAFGIHIQQLEAVTFVPLLEGLL